MDSHTPTTPAPAPLVAPVQWDPRPVLEALERSAPAATTFAAVLDHMRRLDGLVRHTPDCAPFADPGDADGHDAWMERWCAVETGLKERLVALPGPMSPGHAAEALAYVIKDQVRGADDFPADHATWEIARRVARDLRATAALTVPSPSEAAGIAACQGYRAARDRYNHRPDNDGDDAVGWSDYETVRDGVTHFTPVTLAGLIAKAQACQTEREDLDGRIGPLHGTVAEGWAEDILAVLADMHTGAPAGAPPPAPCPVAALADALVREDAIGEALATASPPGGEWTVAAHVAREDALWALVGATRATSAEGAILQLVSAARIVSDLNTNRHAEDEQLALVREAYRHLAAGAAVLASLVSSPAVLRLIDGFLPPYMNALATAEEQRGYDARHRETTAQLRALEERQRRGDGSCLMPPC